MRKIFGVIAILFTAIGANAQPQVTKEFNKILLSDDFSNLSGKWQESSTSENLITGLNPGYEVWRRNRKSGFFVFPEQKKDLQYFEISVGFAFSEKGSKNQSAGLMLMVPEKNNGGVVIEVNRKGQFRVQRAVNNIFSPTTPGDDGWIKSGASMKTSGNVLMIRTYDKIYDLFINGKYVYTFTEIDYSKGSYGLYVGADSRIIFQTLEIKTDEEVLNTENKNPDKIDEDKTLNQIIIRLRETINKKEKRITELEEQLRTANARGGSDTAAIRQKKECEKNMLSTLSEMNNLKAENEALKDKIATLEAFQNQVKTSENGDIVINLTQMNNKQQTIIKDKDKKIEELNLEIERLKFDKANQKQINTSMQVENDQLRNEKLNLEYRIVEKDSLINEQYTKITLLENALEQSSGGGTAPSKPREDKAVKPKKEKKKKRKEEQTLFVE